MNPATHDLRFLFEASRRLNQVLEWDQLLEEIRDLLCEALSAEACSILLWNEDHTRLEFQMAYSRITPDARILSLKPDEGLAGWISKFGEPTIVHDAQADRRFRHAIDQAIGFTTKTVLGLPIVRGGEVIGVLELHNKLRGERFDAEDVRLAEALVDVIAVALQNALLFLSQKRQRAENEILYRASVLLSETPSLDRLLATFLDQLATVVPYQAAALYLLDRDSQELRWFTHRGYPEGTVDRVRLMLGEGAVGWAAKSGQPLVIEDTRNDEHYIAARPETRSEVVVPILTEGQVIGVFNLESDRPAAYRSHDLRILQALANQAGISIQRAELFRERREKERLEDELRFARQIQKLFLPKDPENLPGFDLAALNVPSREVSGDFYDYLRITDGQFGIMIGDVSGKGAAAALIMATLRASLRAEIRNSYSISEIMAKANHLLWESTEPERFATAVYGVLDLRERVFTYANAGHNPPLHLDARGSAEMLDTGGLIMGPFSDSAYEEGRIFLYPGDLLVFYTDGVTEASAPEGEEFGTERLIRTVHENRALCSSEICRAVLNEVRAHAGEGAGADDLTLVVMKAAG